MIYFDMDGVLARFNEDASEEETHRGHYYLYRDPEPSAIHLLNTLSARGYPVGILGAVYQEGTAEEDKRIWLPANGVHIKPTFVPYGTSKTEGVPEGTHILIDDFSKNLFEWERGGNVGIKFRNGINGTKNTWTGYAIDYRMDPEKMFIVVAAVYNSITA